jgi:methylmalonyl-CoA carboxyltransferase 12S subunit
LPADGVVTGAATVDGRLIHLASQDFTVGGGAAGEVHSDKVAEMMRYSLKTGSPFVFINDSGGARVQEGINSLAGYGRVFYMNVMLSGVVPQIFDLRSVRGRRGLQSGAHRFHHPDQGRADVHHRAVGDQTSHRRNCDIRGVGRPRGADDYSGVVHFIAENDDEAAFICRRLLSFLPSNNLEDPPRLAYDGPLDPDPGLNNVVPDDGKVAYDMRAVIARCWTRATFWKCS